MIKKFVSLFGVGALALSAFVGSASAADTVGHGGVLLAFYSLGLAVPFLLTAVAFDRATTGFSWIRTHYAFVPAYADLIPYTNVLVTLPQAGNVRLMGLLTGGDDGVRVGRRVTGLFEDASSRTQDLPVLRWQFEAVS